MLDIISAWQQAQGDLKKQLGPTVFETWIQPLTPRTDSKNGLVLQAPDAFFKEWVEKHYRLFIQQAVDNALGQQGTALFFESGVSKIQEWPAPLSPSSFSIKPGGHQEGLGLNPRYTFENFVVGPSNRHAHAYSLAVADSP
ncbi:MAG: hypothetical protein AMJ95_02995, partial [Omnitrophica WOR_2 bacterium SM23_72]